jgi:seryl-tRNA synthetase
MHDIRSIRENPLAFDAGLARRGVAPIAEQLLVRDQDRRDAVTAIQELQAKRNDLSKEIGLAMAQGRREDAERLKNDVAEIKAAVGKIEARAEDSTASLQSYLSQIPNLPYPDVPDGTDEDDNAIVATHGTPPTFAFAPKEHDIIGPALGLDFETGVALSGARFTLLRGSAARLHRALGQYMLDVLSEEHGFEAVIPPVLVRDEIMYGTGQLPKFAEDSFQTNTGHWLIPTSEVSLTNIVREKILAEGELPLHFTALTSCFRSEAGSAGRDTRGFIRQHQFEKVEMVSIVTPEASEAEHERMTACAEDILTRLGLPFRRMKLCAGDMGFTAARTYDLEVWLPGQDRYREISSVSTCTDFQARRMNARYRPEGEKATRFVHTLNGSGLAVGRTLVAVFENYQQENGSVAIPTVLQPYLRGLDRLEPAASS